MKYDSNNSIIVAIISTCIILMTVLYSLISWNFKESEILAKDYLKHPTKYEIDTIRINDIIIEYRIHEKGRK